MANLQKCSRCKSILDISYFGINRKKQAYKTCQNCRNKNTNKITNNQKEENVISTTASESEEVKEHIKYIIVMDVETNGLIASRTIQPNLTNLSQFPRIVQFSWGLYSENGECQKMKDYIIKPNGWKMNGSDRYHGISQEKAEADGICIQDILKEYKNDIDNNCVRVVCHNLHFDKRVVLSELIRANMEVNEVDEYCTMMNSINFCKKTPLVRGEYKWPSLEELYSKCFNKGFENSHNSYYDVKATAECYLKLIVIEKTKNNEFMWKMAMVKAQEEFKEQINDRAKQLYDEKVFETTME